MSRKRALCIGAVQRATGCGLHTRPLRAEPRNKCLIQMQDWGYAEANLTKHQEVTNLHVRCIFGPVAPLFVGGLGDPTVLGAVVVLARIYKLEAGWKKGGAKVQLHGIQITAGKGPLIPSDTFSTATCLRLGTHCPRREGPCGRTGWLAQTNSSCCVPFHDRTTKA